MSENQILDFKPLARLEQVSDHSPKAAEGYETSARMMRRFYFNARIQPDGIFGNDTSRVELDAGQGDGP
jgi:hypothetical protein